MQKNLYASLIAFFIFQLSSSGQFTNNADALGLYNAGSLPWYGSGVSCYDYNKDGWDDVTLAAKDDAIKVFRNVQGQYFELAIAFPNTADAKHPVWVDYDNDGDADFFCTRYESSCLLYRNDGDDNFVDVSENLNLPSTTALSYGCSWGDYNNDSYLDLFVCNYDLASGILNWLFHNNGDGTFTEVGELMGVAGELATTFASTWFDYDQDNDLDLFVANDHNYGNGLFENLGDTAFQDVSVSSGAVFPLDAMTSTVGDYDSDEDFDIYITNTLGNILLRNDDGIFVNAIDGTNLQCHNDSWGAIWLDYDNDGLNDLYASNVFGIEGDQNYIFKNIGNTFQEMPETFMSDFSATYCVASGDFNNDGFSDLVTTNSFPVSVSCWMNDYDQNNSLKLQLTGTISNKDAIGAKIKWYAGENSYVRQKFCGENFLGQNSQYEILALGSKQFLDTLIITWPSGWIDKFYNLNTGDFYSFVEGETSAQDLNLPDEIFICEGDSVLLTPNTTEYFEWSNGISNLPLWINEPGVYPISVTNEFGFIREEVIYVSLFDNTTVTFSISNPSCFDSQDGSVAFDLGEEIAMELFWNDEFLDMNEVDQLSEGNYDLTYIDENGCSHTEVISLIAPDPFFVEAFADTICHSAIFSPFVQVSGGTGAVQWNWMKQNEQGEWTNWLDEIFQEGDFLITAQDENGCISSDTINIVEYDEMEVNVIYENFCAGETTSADLIIGGGAPPYEIDWDEVNPDELVPGNYSFLVTDFHSCVRMVDVFIPDVMPLSAVYNVTNAMDGQNGALQILVEGGIPPYIFELNGNSAAAYNEGLGQGEYQVNITDASGCTFSSSVTIIDTYVTNPSATAIICYPNPMSDVLNIQSTPNQIISVFDCRGTLILKELSKGTTQLDTRLWSSGAYLIQCGNERILVVKN